MQDSQLKVHGARGKSLFFEFQKSQQASNVKLTQRIESESSCQAAGRVVIGFVIRPCKILIGGGGGRGTGIGKRGGREVVIIVSEYAIC